MHFFQTNTVRVRFGFGDSSVMVLVRVQSAVSSVQGCERGRWEIWGSREAGRTPT